MLGPFLGPRFDPHNRVRELCKLFKGSKRTEARARSLRIVAGTASGCVVHVGLLRRKDVYGSSAASSWQNGIIIFLPDSPLTEALPIPPIYHLLVAVRPKPALPSRHSISGRP